MRTLAVDFGTKRIGLALSDAGGRLATPGEVLEAGSETEALEKISKLIDEEAVQRIIVGLPLNMDGTRGPSAKLALDFGKRLASRSGKTVLFVDERLSSFQAEQDLLGVKQAGQKLTRKGKKRRLDAVAAAGFLQEFLDGKLTALES